MLQSLDSLESQAPQSVNWLEAGDILLYLPFFGHPTWNKRVVKGCIIIIYSIIYILHINLLGFCQISQGTFRDHGHGSYPTMFETPLTTEVKRRWRHRFFRVRSIHLLFHLGIQRFHPFQMMDTLKAGQSQLEWLRRDIVPLWTIIRTDLTDWIGSFMEPFQLVMVVKSMEW